MKILVLGAQARYEKYLPQLPFIRQQELVFRDKDTPVEQLLARDADADILFVDAITPVPAALIDGMPKLKLVHSEGVAYDKIDLAAARARGVYVCNNKGCNAGAVAEQAIMLMLMLLRREIPGDRAVREGRQMEVKERSMTEGIRELSDCRVGLVGFGDIARATAERLAPFGCEIYYYTTTPLCWPTAPLWRPVSASATVPTSSAPPTPTSSVSGRSPLPPPAPGTAWRPAPAPAARRRPVCSPPPVIRMRTRTASVIPAALS